MSATPSRFTFDLDLGRGPLDSQFLSEGARQSLRQEAHAAGRAEGVAAGEASAAAAAAQALAVAANRLADQAAALLAGLDASRGTLEGEAVALAASVGRKLATGLLEAEPTAELEILLAECLSSLGAVPHLVVRCHPDLADRLRAAAEARIAQSGFAGRLVVLGEPDIRPGDGRIEWADGGLVRDSAAISAAIDARIAAYLAARRPTPSQGEPPMTPGDNPAAPPADRGITFEEMRATARDDQMPPGERTAADLEAVFDVPVRISVVLGRTRMAVASLLKLDVGTVVELDRQVGEAIEIYVNDKLVARGEIVLVENRLGVTMTEIVKAG